MFPANVLGSGARDMLYVLAAIVILFMVLAAVVIIGAPHLERSLMYAADPRYTNPKKAGAPAFTEHTLHTPDGEQIISWYAPAEPGQPTLLYIHGNAGTLADRAERITAYHEEGRGCLIMSYRGYSGSTGRPSEKANVADAKLAFDTLVNWGIEPQDIFIYGESIGTGIAVQVAGDRRPGGLILDAPYTSIVDVGEMHYPYLPARLMMRDRYETMRHLKRITAPLLVIHGEQDRVIPVEMGRKVAASSPTPSDIVTFRGAGHSDHAQFGSFAAVNDWIDRQRRSDAANPLAEAG